MAHQKEKTHEAPAIRTADEIRAEFDRTGRTLADFVREHDLDYHTAHQVLSGKKKGRRGEAHRCAVALGLKQGVAA